MKRSNIVPRRFCYFAVLIIALSGFDMAQAPARQQWGAPDVSVTKAGGTWVIAGRKNKVTFNVSDLALKVNAGSEVWQMVPSATGDMTVRTEGRDVDLRLADASRIAIVPYDTGFKKGIKISLGNWQIQEKPLDLGLTLTVCLEGDDEELVFGIAADE